MGCVEGGMWAVGGQGGAVCTAQCNESQHVSCHGCCESLRSASCYHAYLVLNVWEVRGCVSPTRKPLACLNHVLLVLPITCVLTDHTTSPYPLLTYTLPSTPSGLPPPVCSGSTAALCVSRGCGQPAGGGSAALHGSGPPGPTHPQRRQQQQQPGSRDSFASRCGAVACCSRRCGERGVGCRSSCGRCKCWRRWWEGWRG